MLSAVRSKCAHWVSTLGPHPDCDTDDSHLTVVLVEVAKAVRRLYPKDECRPGSGNVVFLMLPFSTFLELEPAGICVIFWCGG